MRTCPNKMVELSETGYNELQLTEDMVAILKEANQDRIAYQWRQIDDFQRLRKVEGKKKLLENLIRKGANINTPDKSGWTPLMHASCMDLVEFVAFFIAKGADIHHVAPDQRTAINLAKVTAVREQFSSERSYFYYR